MTIGVYRLFLISATAILVLTACHSPGDNNGPEQAEASFSARKPLLIQFQPFGKVPSEHLELAMEALTSYYRCEVEVQEPAELPEEAWYAPRSRYRADSLLRHLHRRRPDRYHLVVGLTEMDISVTKPPYSDWGIMGLGSYPLRAGVVSTYRMNKGMSDEQFRNRLKRVTRHELGHALGLRHCEDPGCFMRDAKGMAKTIDQAGDELCDRCKAVVGRFLRE